MASLRALRAPACAALALVAACAVVLHRNGEWLSPIARDHPLVGVIWDVAARRPVTRAALLDRLAASCPQRRLIEPEEVAYVTVMLASERARGITGQAIQVDGGAVMA